MKKTKVIKEEIAVCDWCGKEDVDSVCAVCRKDICNVHSFFIPARDNESLNDILEPYNASVRGYLICLDHIFSLIDMVKEENK